MPETLEKLQARLVELESQIEAEWDKRRAEMRYHIERRKIVFDQGIKDAHRKMRVRWSIFLRRTRPMVILTAPVIYSIILPLVLLDLFVTIYQWICFPVYRITKVRRSDHVVIDRHNLAYLNVIQKFNCIYCGYGNGVISYAREVAGRTEKFWCPIKHASRVRDAHPHYADFPEFGDAQGFQEQSPRLRRELREQDD